MYIFRDSSVGAFAASASHSAARCHAAAAVDIRGMLRPSEMGASFHREHVPLMNEVCRLGARLHSLAWELAPSLADPGVWL
jgi:hypothetical protein